MSTLLIRTLDETQTQKIKINRSINVHSIRLHIVKCGTMDSSLIVSVLDGATTLMSKEITASEINTYGDYIHGFLKFEFENLRLNKKGTEESHEYTLQIEYSGNCNTNTYLALVQAYENPIVDAYGSGQVNGVPYNDALAPFGIEIYTLES